MAFQPKSAATGFLNAAACVSLVGGIITGLVFGNQTFGGDFFSAAATWVGWAFFACGFAGFVLFAAAASLVDRLTGIRYMLSLTVHDDPKKADESNAMQPRDIRNLAVDIHTASAAQQDR